KPGEISPPPFIAEQSLRCRRISQKESPLAMWIHQVRGKAARDWRLRVDAQVGGAAVFSRDHRPIEFGADFHVTLAAREILLNDLGFRGRCAKSSDAFFEERRAEGDMLGPAYGPVSGRKIFDGFCKLDYPRVQVYAALERKLGNGKSRAHHE